MGRNAEDTLGKTIKSARLERGWTREKFAEMVGLSPRYVMSIENENKKPSYKKLFKLIRTLGVPADAIFYPEKAIEDVQTQRLLHMLEQCEEWEIKGIIAMVEVLRATP
ncbi:MAG: helix-turn-helix domain-containing protein [Peptococcaceae bacterium]|jgi:transcriptional regulator with XRE-family HTH domain|nr:helix-turn-helix domain-containing protein [Peptococcaceae bacterium]